MNDVFISYKSDDAEAVRDVVEVLRINGLATWFAEYSISLEDWLNRDDSWIDATLRTAIEQSRHVIVFSSAAWHASDWCRLEHRSSLERLGVESLSIIRLSRCEHDSRFQSPPHEIFDYGEENVPELCRFLSRRLRRSVELPAGPSPLGRAALLANGPYAATLCCAPLEKFDYLILRGLIGRVCGMPVRCTFAFHPRRTTGVLRGASGEELTQLAAQRTARPELAQKSPDRVVYREYAQRAFAASSASGMKVFGLHLLTNATADSQAAPAGLSGNTAFGVSKIQQTGSTTFVLGRDYSLRLSNGPDAPVGELMLLFEVDARCGSEEQARLQLSRVAPYLDRVAASVRYHGNSVDFVRRASLRRAAVRSVVLFALCGVAVRLFGGLPAFTWTWALYALFAFCGVSVVLSLAREILQRRFLWPTFRIVVK